MHCVLIFADKTGRIHVSDGEQLWNLGTITTDMTGTAARGVQARLLRDWTPNQTTGHAPEELAEIVAPVHDGTRLIAMFRDGRLHLNTDPDGHLNAAAASRRYLGIEGTRGKGCAGKGAPVGWSLVRAERGQCVAA
jgi:hypothetical protein